MYTLADTNQMSWSEFQSIVDLLISEIKKSNIKFDAVAPILRNGGVPGTIIANKLQIITMLPIQLKGMNEGDEVEQILPFVLPIENRLSDSPSILVVETNTITGKSAVFASKIIRQALPNAKIYYATVGRVYRNQEVKLDMYEQYFWGIMTNELFEASKEIEQKLNLRPGITIYPWETPEFELAEIN